MMIGAPRWIPHRLVGNHDGHKRNTRICPEIDPQNGDEVDPRMISCTSIYNSYYQWIELEQLTCYDLNYCDDWGHAVREWMSEDDSGRPLALLCRWMLPTEALRSLESGSTIVLSVDFDSLSKALNFVHFKHFWKFFYQLREANFSASTQPEEGTTLEQILGTDWIEIYLAAT